ncbi:DUF1156 domain-containing protein [Halorussus halobius]|uniref:DUF1156 domain-containing protein n=1 Tax=Halorussus halobius TaxID=1710537 RepID=UPI00143DF468|nr:DUF1156 domain-containing protein [Halorussus halobius]
MSQENRPRDEEELKRVAIEGKLPLKAVGIENLKEANPKHMPPHRYLHPWFARRPTPASRLAILASVLPNSVEIDDLLKWMQIGPKRPIDSSINDYVKEKKQTEGERSGTLGDHYGYPRPFTSTPGNEEREEIHSKLRDFWGGELPTVLDPTAGGGVIPFESLRYGLPTQANELNPVASTMLKVLLEYAPEVGSLEDELIEWSQKIDQRAQENLEEYFPGKNSRQVPEYYACSYTVKCADCGYDIPLVPKWWLRKKSASKGVAIKPSFDDEGNLKYRAVTLPDDIKKSEFNPQNGPVTRGDAECMNCGVVTEDETIKEYFNDGEFEYEIIGVKYREKEGGSGYRAPTDKDVEAFNRAAEQVKNDIDLSTILSIDIPDGQETARTSRHGIEQWRDIFSPRQLISHHEYLQSFEHFKSDIREKHSEKEAEAILTILSLVSSKLVDRNSRLTPWDTSKGYPSQIFKGNNLAFRRVFIDNNLTISGMGYQAQIEKIIESYEEIESYIPDDGDSAWLTSVDAANLPQESNSVEAVVIDPPYYSSVQYSELSDVFYVWLKEYLDDVHPDLFTSELTNKEDEAVAKRVS